MCPSSDKYLIIDAAFVSAEHFPPLLKIIPLPLFSFEMKATLSVIISRIMLKVRSGNNLIQVPLFKSKTIALNLRGSSSLK